MLGCILMFVTQAAAGAIEKPPPPPARKGSAAARNEASNDVLTPWARMSLAQGASRSSRLKPPRKGRKTCIDVDNIAGAELFGDAAIELTMRDGKRWRMFLDQECPALSFYQGFYYRRSKANIMCAGRDVIGARSGGECPIASIIAVEAPERRPPEN